VEYVLREARKPIGVATYWIVKRLPAKKKNLLRPPGQIAKLPEDLE
jgi:hypothetical protein